MYKTIILCLIVILNSCALLERSPSSSSAENIKKELKTLNFVVDENIIEEMGRLCADEILKISSKSASGNRLLVNDEDSEVIKEAFSLCLSYYVKIPSVNPPGNEHLTALYLETIFKGLEIPYKKFVTKINDHAERTNLIATLSAKGLSPEGQTFYSRYDWENSAKGEISPSIILLNHMDVVPAIAEDWDSKIHPFSGVILNDDEIKKIKAEIADGEDYLFGRGSLDMKSIGMMQLFSMALIKLNHLPIFKDIHFMAVADEESGGIGARGAMNEIKSGGRLEALKGAEIVLNEGGMGIRKAIDGRTIHLIGTEEKGGAWLAVEGSNLQNLIETLAIMHAFDLNAIERAWGAIKSTGAGVSLSGRDCRLVTANVPIEKPNVLTSEISAEIECKKDISDLENHFNKLANRLQPFIVKILVERNKIGLKIKASSSAHGSVSIGNTVLEVWAFLLNEMELIKLKSLYKKPNFYKYVNSMATQGILGELEKISTLVSILRLFNSSSIDTMILKKVEDGLGREGFFRTNCQWTTFRYEGDAGKAYVDCRLLHPLLSQYAGNNHAEMFVDLLNKKFTQGETSYRLVEGWNVSTSPHNMGYQILKDIISTKDKNILVAPYIFPAGSDSTYFRNPKFWGNEELKPIPSYGFFPIETTDKVLTTFHGSFERFPLSQIIPGLDKLYRAVLKLSRTYYTPTYEH